MKLSKIIFFLLIILTSCSKIIDRTQIIGNWYLIKVNGGYAYYTNSTYTKDKSPFVISFYDNYNYKAVQSYKDNLIEITVTAQGKYYVDYAITFIEFTDSEIVTKIKLPNLESNMTTNIPYSYNDCMLKTTTNLVFFDSLYSNFYLEFVKD